MFMDEHRRKVWDDIRQQDFKALGRFLTPDIFAEAARRAGVAFGKGPLYVVNLVWLGIAAAIHRTENFAGILTFTLKLLADQESYAATPVARAQRQGRNDRADAGGLDCGTTRAATTQPWSAKRLLPKPGG